MLRNHGMQRRYYHDMLGYNFRMTDLHAAIGLVQIDRLAGFTATAPAPMPPTERSISPAWSRPRCEKGYGHVWHQYTVRVDRGRDRDAAVKQLNDGGRRARASFIRCRPTSRPTWRTMGLGEVALPVAERMAQEVISLPVHPQLSQADLEKIVAEVNRL